MSEEVPIELYRTTNNEFVKYVKYDDYKKLENIIKEVREYIEENKEETTFRFTEEGSYNAQLLDLLDILDKVGDEK